MYILFKGAQDAEGDLYSSRAIQDSFVMVARLMIVDSLITLTKHRDSDA